MKTFVNLLLASALAFTVTSLAASSAHALRRSPILEQHLQGSGGNWNRGGNPRSYGYTPPPKAAPASVPELDPGATASSLALLLAIAMLRPRRREDALATVD